MPFLMQSLSALSAPSVVACAAADAIAVGVPRADDAGGRVLDEPGRVRRKREEPGGIGMLLPPPPPAPVPPVPVEPPVPPPLLQAPPTTVSAPAPTSISVLAKPLMKRYDIFFIC